MLFVDKQGAMKMAQNDSINERSKHIEMKYHFTKHHVQTSNVKLEYIYTDEQVADIMTKMSQARNTASSLLP